MQGNLGKVQGKKLRRNDGRIKGIKKKGIRQGKQSWIEEAWCFLLKSIPKLTELFTVIYFNDQTQMCADTVQCGTDCTETRKKNLYLYMTLQYVSVHRF